MITLLVINKINLKVVSSNPDHDEVQSITHFVIKFVGQLQQVCRFSPGTSISSTNP